MKDSKFNSFVYVFAGLMGVLIGGSFSEYKYYKGKEDAYEEVNGKLREFADEVEKALSENEEEA